MASVSRDESPPKRIDEEELSSSEFSLQSGGEHAMAIPVVSLSETPVQPPKKKRRSPAVPWKKPVDMPKRPLSAYNLFFASEREKLIKQLEKSNVNEDEIENLLEKSSFTSDTPMDGESIVTNNDDMIDASFQEQLSYSGKGKRLRPSGVGFAGLAKSIAAKWKTLNSEDKTPYNEKASIDKIRYDVAVAEWRQKQKAEKETSLNPAKVTPAVLSMSDPMIDQSYTEISHGSDSYPSEWLGMLNHRVPNDAASRFHGETYTTYLAPQQMFDVVQGLPRSQQAYDRDFYGSLHPSITTPGESSSEVSPPQDCGHMSYTSGVLKWSSVPGSGFMRENQSHIANPRSLQNRDRLSSGIPDAFCGTSRSASPHFRASDRQYPHRVEDAFAWNTSTNWSHQPVPHMPSQSGNQFDPLPYDSSLSYPPLHQLQKSFLGQSNRFESFNSVQEQEQTRYGWVMDSEMTDYAFMQPHTPTSFRDRPDIHNQHDKRYPVTSNIHNSYDQRAQQLPQPQYQNQFYYQPSMSLNMIHTQSTPNMTRDLAFASNEICNRSFPTVAGGNALTYEYPKTNQESLDLVDPKVPSPRSESATQQLDDSTINSITESFN